MCEFEAADEALLLVEAAEVAGGVTNSENWLPQSLFDVERRSVLLSKTGGSKIDERLLQLFASVYTNMANFEFCV